MKRIILFLIFTTTIINCNTNDETETISGEIYIKLIDFGSMYGAPKEKVEELKNKIINNREIIKNESDKVFVNYFKKLIKYELLEKPHFKLKLSNGSIVDVFTEEDEYVELKSLLDNLKKEEEKIIVKFIGIEKDKGIFHAERILTNKKVPGKTDWDK